MVASFRTCAVKHANGNAADEFRLRHMQLIDQAIDHCFAKCLWTESGQYDATNNSIDVSKVIAELAAKGYAVPSHLIELSEATDGSCRAIFEKTRTFVQREMSNNPE